MRAGQNVGPRCQGPRRIGGPQQDQLGRIAAQFQKAVGADLAIFQRLVIRPHPKQRLFPRRPYGQTGGKPARAPIAGIDFMQGTRQQPAAQRLVGRRHAQGKGRPVGGQAITGQVMAQIGQFC